MKSIVVRVVVLLLPLFVMAQEPLNDFTDCTIECAPHSLSCHTENGGSSLSQSGKLVDLCECPVNYGGVACDIPLPPCTLDSDCSTGKECSEHGYCSNDACTTLGTVLHSEFATFACRKRLTEYCAGDDDDDDFCTNGGKCTAGFQYAEAGTEGSVCKCPPEFTGPHCEFAKLPASVFLPGAVYASSSRKSNKTTVVVAVVGTISVALIALAVMKRRRRRRQSQHEAGEFAAVSDTRDLL